MKISQINNNLAFGAKVEITDKANSDIVSYGFMNSLAPDNLSKREAKKVEKALNSIKNVMPEETVIFDRDGFYITAKAKNSGTEIARMDRVFNWPRLIIKTAKIFKDKYAPVMDALGNVIKK